MTAIWIACIMLLCGIMIPLVTKYAFGSEEEMAIYYVTFSMPSMIAIMGPIFATIDSVTVGALYAAEMLLMTAIVVALMNIFLILRHTRQDEENGRQEMIRSLAVGREATLGATMLFALVLNTLIAILLASIMTMLNIQSMDFFGNLCFGVAIGTIGVVFASITAVFCQLCASSKAAMGYSLAMLCIMFILRAIGDISSEMLSLISPLGLVLRVKAYVENDYLPILILLVFSALLCVLAFYLNSIRDLEQGFILAKKGRANAPKYLSSAFGLAYRLLFGGMVAWIIGMFVFAFSYGTMLGDMEEMLAGNEMFQAILPQSEDFTATEAFLSMLNSILSLICSIPIINAILRLRSEEKNKRLEHIMAKPVSRINNMLSYITIAFISSLIIMFLTVLGLFISSEAIGGGVVRFVPIVVAMLSYLPAVWFMLAVAVFFVGALPKYTICVWLYTIFVFIAVYLGGMLNLPEFVMNISVFSHIPKLPLEKFTIIPLTVITILAITLCGIGVYTYNNRDLD